MARATGPAATPEEIADPARRLWLRGEYELLNTIGVAKHMLSRAEHMLRKHIHEFPELAARWGDADVLAKYTWETDETEMKVAAIRAKQGPSAAAEEATDDPNEEDQDAR